MKAIQIAYDQFFEKKCQFASEVGFKYISVNFSDSYTPEDFSDTPNPFSAICDNAPEHITKILEKYNLKAAQTHLYYYYPLQSADIIDDALEHRVLREIEVSGKIGAKWCVWHPRYYVSGEWETGEYDEEKTLYYNHKTVTGYLEQAKRFNTGIALENLWGSMIRGGSPMLARLCDSFNADNVGICWDTGHGNIMEHEQAQDEAIRFLGERIKCTHIHNNFKNFYDLHLPPDAGNIEWDKVMKAFKDIGYEGPLTLETHCLYPEDDKLLRDFARYNFNCLEFIQRLQNSL